MVGPSLLEHVDSQLGRLCDQVGVDRRLAGRLLTDLLGSAASEPLSAGPVSPSNVADDGSPVEFSIAFNERGRPALRVLGEALGQHTDGSRRLSYAHRFISIQARRFGLSTSRFERVRELFSADDPRGDFGIWHSMIFRGTRRPEFKVYCNPEIRGVEQAPELVAEALRRLGLGGSDRSVLHGLRPGQLGRADRLTFFAVDLDDGPSARVKLYLTHHDADLPDVVRAAGAVDGVDPAELAEFCVTACGGPGPYAGRPLITSYTFLEQAHRPAGFSLYVPIRSYVSDDEEARDRVVMLLDRYGFDSADLDRAIGAVTQRPLDEGVGLIAHVSLRLGPPRPGVTVYLSAEAYQVSPSRPRRIPAF